MKKQYNKEKCRQKVRAIIKDKYGNTIILMGKHAFNWEIVKETNGRIIITSYPSRIEALKALRTLKQ